MACHLSHKLPWDSIDQLARLMPDPEVAATTPRVVLNDAQRKKLGHFARCLAAAIAEFKASDKSSEDERQAFDPCTWPGQRAQGMGAWLGFYETLPGGYVALNLLLMDAKRFQRQCERGGLGKYFVASMLGFHDGGHPPHMSEHLDAVITSDYGDNIQFQPLTREAMQVLRDHAARLFRCMYSISGDNRLLDGDYLASQLEVCMF